MYVRLHSAVLSVVLCHVVRAGERVALHCIDRHPTQPHIVATGGADGALSLWDMRQDRYPITLLTAHSADGKNHCHRYPLFLQSSGKNLRFSRPEIP